MEEQKNNVLPTIFVIFGATGDLMRKKLALGLFHLYQKKQLPKLFQVIGFARQELTHGEFREEVFRMIEQGDNKAKKEDIRAFVQYFMYERGLFEEREGYENLARYLGRKDKAWQVCSNKLFYLAVPPQFYETIFKLLSKSGLTEPCSLEEGWTRVLVEKPFGNDFKTARRMDEALGKLFQEVQVYRIDHYLAKETVQNILAFRFSNSFLEDSWNKESIESIHIRFFESFGIGTRGGSYDSIGALRDVGQNHMLQLLALFCMENPRSYVGDAVRQKRAEVLRALKIYRATEVQKHSIRGQYEGYKREKRVDTDSKTETYFKIKAFLKNQRWQGVPIYLESGKALERDLVEVKLVFRHPTPCLCPPEAGKHYQNILSYRIQPTEEIRISFWAKKPGEGVVLEEKDFIFDYKSAFYGDEMVDAYEKLVANAIKGDQTLFVSTEEILASWKFIDPIIRSWQNGGTPLIPYKKKDAEIHKIALPSDEK